MNLNLKALIGKLNDSSRSALEAAAGLCLARTHYDIEIEHFLLKAMDSADNDVARIFHYFEVDTSRLTAELTRGLDKLKSGNARTPAFSPSVVRMLTEAWSLGSIDFDATQIRTGVAVLALATNDELIRLVREMSREFAKVEGSVLHKEFASIVDGSREDVVASRSEAATQDGATKVAGG